MSGYPEVIAVEDITYLGCEITDIIYEWKGEGNFDTPLVTSAEPCPPWSVTRSFSATIEEAEKFGFPYVVLAGDYATDASQVIALKQALLPTSEDHAMGLHVNGATRALLASCRGYSKSRSVSYWAGGTGAGVTATAYYYQATNCGWYLNRAKDYIFDPLSSGQDLYWDEVYLNGPFWASWDAGCRRMYDYGTYTTYTSGYEFWINNYFTDETINDSSLGCSWWGEEYNGSVLLTS